MSYIKNLIFATSANKVLLEGESENLFKPGEIVTHEDYNDTLFTVVRTAGNRVTIQDDKGNPTVTADYSSLTLVSNKSKDERKEKEQKIIKQLEKEKEKKKIRRAQSEKETEKTLEPDEERGFFDSIFSSEPDESEGKEAEETPGFSYNELDPNELAFYDPNRNENSLSLNGYIPTVKTSVAFSRFVNSYLEKTGLFYTPDILLRHKLLNSKAFVNNGTIESVTSNGNMPLAKVLFDAISIFNQTPYIKDLRKGSSGKPVTLEIINGGLRYGSFKVISTYVAFTDAENSTNLEGPGMWKKRLNPILAAGFKKVSDLNAGPRNIIKEFIRITKPKLKDLNLPDTLFEAILGDKRDDIFTETSLLDTLYKAIVIKIVEYYTEDMSSEESLEGLCTYIKKHMLKKMVLDSSGGVGDSSKSNKVDLENPNKEENGGDGISNIGGFDQDILDSLIDIANENDLLRGEQVVDIRGINSLSDSRVCGNAIMSIFYQIMNIKESTSGDIDKYPLKENGKVSYKSLREVLELYIIYLKGLSKYTGELPETLLNEVIPSENSELRVIRTDNIINSDGSVTNIDIKRDAFLLEEDPKKIVKNITNTESWKHFPKFLLDNSDLYAVQRLALSYDIKPVAEEVTIKPLLKKKLALDTSLPGFDILLGNLSKNAVIADKPVFLSALKDKIKSQFSSEIDEIVTLFKNIAVSPTRDFAGHFKEVLDKYFSIESFDIYWNLKSLVLQNKLLTAEELEQEIFKNLPAILGFLFLDIGPSVKSNNIPQIKTLFTLSDQLFADTTTVSDVDLVAKHAKTKELSDKEVIKACLEYFSKLLTKFTKLLPPYAEKLVKALNYCFYKILILQDYNNTDQSVKDLFTSLYYKSKGDNEYDTKDWPKDCLDINNPFSKQSFEALQKVIKLSSNWQLKSDNSYLTDEVGLKYFDTLDQFQDFMANKKAIFPNQFESSKKAKKKIESDIQDSIKDLNKKFTVLPMAANTGKGIIKESIDWLCKYS